MTLNKLIKRLQELQSMGLGRRRVCVDKDSLWDGNGTYQICEATCANAKFILEADGDGFIVENKDGSERGTVTIVIGGASTPIEEKR